jgi:hypothetical protein
MGKYLLLFPALAVLTHENRNIIIPKLLTDIKKYFVAKGYRQTFSPLISVVWGCQIIGPQKEAYA